jgi:thiamine-phosphate pyrophosphorylase
MSFKKILPEGLYGITAEKFSRGRSNKECVRAMLDGGIKIIQYREKYKPIREKITEAAELRKLCMEYEALFIVNDDIDLALLVKADGIHLGQDDFPIKDARKIIGNNMILGCSTHSPEQAKQAEIDGADYIGVGPIFKTETKENVCDPVGLEYLNYAVKNSAIPFVAIGGIKYSNIDQVISQGAKTICLVSEIVGAEDIGGIIKMLNEKLV